MTPSLPPHSTSGPAPPYFLSSSCTLLGVCPSHLKDLRDEVNYAGLQNPVKPNLSPSCLQSPWNVLLVPRTHAQEWHTCSGPSKVVFTPQMDWQMNLKLWAFQVFVFLTEKLSFLPIGLDMLIWSMWFLYNKDTLYLLEPEATSTVSIRPHKGAHGIPPRWAGQVESLRSGRKCPGDCPALLIH